MSGTLRLWGRDTSYNVQKVLWALDELGEDFEQIPLGGPAGGLDDPQIVALNPMKRVPILADGKVSLWESNSILRYLGETRGKLWPAPNQPNSLENTSRLNTWMDFQGCGLSAHLVPLLLHALGRMPRPVSPKEQVWHQDRFREHLDGLARAINAKQFPLEPNFSMADIAIAVVVQRWISLGQTIPSPVAAWYQPLAERAAFRVHVFMPPLVNR